MNLTDTGILSSDKLPIYALKYGGSLTPYSSIDYNIGSLVCSGKKGIFPSETDDFEKQSIKSRLSNLEKQIPSFVFVDEKKTNITDKYELIKHLVD